MTEGHPRVARVLLDSGLPQLDHLFDYEIPEPLRADIRVGQRVKVPFRSRQRDSLGYVIELAHETDFSGELAVLSEVVSPIIMLTPEVWRLVRAVADRAGGSAADLIRVAIPNRHVRTERAFLSEREVKNSEAHDGEVNAAAAAEVEAEPEHASVEAEKPREAALAGQLIEGSRVSLSAREAPVRLPTGEWVSAWAHTLALTAISVHRRGHSAVIAVPDYRDLDQIHDTLSALGMTEAIRLDSRQSAGDRYRNFLLAGESQPTIVIGNRSVVYAPVYRLGAMLLWNDGDPLLGEPLTPYVHARDAALVRAQQSGAGLVFASYVPSGEALRLVDMGYFEAASTGGAKLNIMHSGALTSDERVPGRIPEFATKALRSGVLEGPVLVQVATPGYAPIMVCATCHDLARCRSCSGPLAQSRAGAVACRWCGEAARGVNCDTCGGTTLEMRGAGSERTADQFSKMFPETMVIVSDGAHQRSRVDARPAVVVATRGAEPIAAGGYRAVVLLDVDRLVGAPSLRAGEDALRWWHGAAALAAPGAPIVITGGAGAIVRAFVTGREREWLRSELADRAQLRFAPAVRVVTVSGARPLVDEALAAVSDVPGTDVLGPASAADDTVRAIVRFSYAHGAEIATRLRAVLVAQAGSSAARSYAARKRGHKRGAAAGTLRLRFDDAQAFEEHGDEEQ